MDEEQALQAIDDELGAALSGVCAPRNLAANVLRRVRQPRVTRIPELLDFIGWAAVLAIAFIVLLWLTPDAWTPSWIMALASAAVIPSLYFGVRSLREIAK